MNSNLIRDLLVQVNAVFGVPEKAKHFLTLGFAEFPDRLVLHINTSEGFRPLVFDPGEPISMDQLLRIKESMDSQTEEEKNQWVKY